MARNLLKKVSLAPLLLLLSTSSYALSSNEADLNNVNKMLQKNIQEQFRLEQESKLLQAKIEQQKKAMEAKLEQQKKIIAAQKELALHQRIHAIPSAQKHTKIDKAIQDLANRLFSSSRLKKEKIEDIALTAFVNLHNFDTSSHFGRTLSEAFFDELYIRGFNVSDFRGQETISINNKGEYLLTRNIKKLNKDIASDHALVGTYSLFENKILINARVVDLMSGKIVASARANYITEDCKVLNTCAKPRKIMIISAQSNKLNAKKVMNTTNSLNKPVKPLIQYYVKREDKEIIAHTKTKEPLVNLTK